MKASRTTSSLLAILVSAALTAIAPAQDTATNNLKFISEGASVKTGFYTPQRLTLSADKPTDLKKAPDLTAPLYGELKFAGKSYLVALDEPAEKDATLYVDSNGNGDLTDDAPTVWKKKPNGPGTFIYSGSFKLPILINDKSTDAQLLAYRFDKNDPKREAQKMVLLYHPDYGYEGTLKLNDSEYHAMLVDLPATGDFQTKGEGKKLGTSLLVDVNANGKFDSVGERFSADKPFNVKGTSWKLADLTPGGAFSIVKSDVAVAEVAPPPKLSKGSPAISFKAQKMDDTPVDFPNDYKGKLVILDFWATWCGPCMGEVPGLVKAYDQFHPKGIEVLGISLDQADSADKVKKVAADHNMTWPQVYDGKFWQSAVAKKYGIDSIPHPFLIDGDTGKVIAEGSSLRGDALVPTLQAALDEKAKAAAK